MFIDKNGDPRYVRIVALPILAILFLIIFFGSFGTVGIGEEGMRVRLGALVGAPLHSGLYFKAPFIEHIALMDMKVQKEQVDATAASADLQDVNTTVAMNWHLDEGKVQTIFRTVGQSWRDNNDVKVRLIDPAMQEAIKASTAKFTAEQLITKREEVRSSIKLALAEKLEPRGVMVDDFNIVNFKFSPVFEQAIEAKVSAEQNALAAKNKLSQVQFEAQQKVATAQGEADAIRIEASALQDNPGVLSLRWIEKWDGKQPLVTGNATPFVDLGSLK